MQADGALDRLMVVLGDMLEGWRLEKKCVQEFSFGGEEMYLSGVCFFSASKTAKLHLLRGDDNQKISEF